MRPFHTVLISRLGRVKEMVIYLCDILVRVCVCVTQLDKLWKLVHFISLLRSHVEAFLVHDHSDSTQLRIIDRRGALNQSQFVYPAVRSLNRQHEQFCVEPPRLYTRQLF